MTKAEFLSELRKALCGLPRDDIEERLSFYSEMIDDRIEVGLSEDEAVADIGNVEDITQQIIAETPIIKIAKDKIKKRRFATWEIVLLAVGSPIWLALLLSAFAVLISLYAVLWSVLISLWAVFVSFAASALACIFVNCTYIGKYSSSKNRAYFTKRNCP